VCAGTNEAWASPIGINLNKGASEFTVVRPELRIPRVDSSINTRRQGRSNPRWRGPTSESPTIHPEWHIHASGVLRQVDDVELPSHELLAWLSRGTRANRTQGEAGQSVAPESLGNSESVRLGCELCSDSIKDQTAELRGQIGRHLRRVRCGGFGRRWSGWRR